MGPDIADVLTEMKFTKSREKCTFDEMCDHTLRDADTRRAGEISTPRQRRGIRTCCEPLSDDGRSPDTMRRSESNARPSYARGRKAKKCGRDRPTRRRQRRDACGSAARGGGYERLYVRAVTATSGDAGARRET